MLQIEFRTGSVISRWPGNGILLRPPLNSVRPRAKRFLRSSFDKSAREPAVGALAQTISRYRSHENNDTAGRIAVYGDSSCFDMQSHPQPEADEMSNGCWALMRMFVGYLSDGKLISAADPLLHSINRPLSSPSLSRDGVRRLYDDAIVQQLNEEDRLRRAEYCRYTAHRLQYDFHSFSLCCVHKQVCPLSARHRRRMTTVEDVFEYYDAIIKYDLRLVTAHRSLFSQRISRTIQRFVGIVGHCVKRPQCIYYMN